MRRMAPQEWWSTLKCSPDQPWTGFYRRLQEVCCWAWLGRFSGTEACGLLTIPAKAATRKCCLWGCWPVWDFHNSFLSCNSCEDTWVWSRGGQKVALRPSSSNPSCCKTLEAAPPRLLACTNSTRISKMDSNMGFNNTCFKILKDASVKYKPILRTVHCQPGSSRLGT